MAERLPLYNTTQNTADKAAAETAEIINAKSGDDSDDFEHSPDKLVVEELNSLTIQERNVLYEEVRWPDGES